MPLFFELIPEQLLRSICLIGRVEGSLVGVYLYTFRDLQRSGSAAIHAFMAHYKCSSSHKIN